MIPIAIIVGLVTAFIDTYIGAKIILKRKNLSL